MARSKWKGSFIHIDLLKKNNKQPEITQRHSTIPDSITNKFLYIHTGNGFKKIFLSKEKIGLKFGELSFTRKLKTKNLSKLKK